MWRFFFRTITGVKNSSLLGSPRSNSRRFCIDFRQEIISGSRKMTH